MNRPEEGSWSPKVSVVIPTVGRATLGRAVRSVLDQTYPVAEILVVADVGVPLPLPRDDRIVELRTAAGSGSGIHRQLGIDRAAGSVIALLDDDDEWRQDKLRRQLDAVAHCADGPWVASSRAVVAGAGKCRIWPRHLIRSRQPVSEYLFRRTDLTSGGAVLMTSTLCFPAGLARQVRWDDEEDAPHDEPSWLLRVQAALPEVHFEQLPQPLCTYHVGDESLSHSTRDRTDEYVEWGRRHLGDQSARILGDYLCTSPVSAAVSARSLSGLRRAVVAALRHGRPGPWALAYAGLSAVRIVLLEVRRR
ncbi:glycosyltransferase family 2 protein [Rhodococcus sp. NPDC003318]|uniref:glycosyltransferase family 2 protein n=1 Tax=Rhodococcus sp. NPDC003318 TaxID=3364503 RepID=UPI0036C895C6